jgi:hypothetical protein
VYLTDKNCTSTNYNATTKGEAYFITITTIGWIDVYTRLRQKYVLSMVRIGLKSKGKNVTIEVLKE